MKVFVWDIEKNERLKKERNISFEDVLIAVQNGGLLDRLKHPNTKKYPGQTLLIVQILTYVYLVPCVEDEQKIFLKTVIPSRKATRRYLIQKKKGGK